MNITFTKMHGCGNDYIYINCLENMIENPEGLSRLVSDRHFGIGGDGVVLICSSKPSTACPFARKSSIINTTSSLDKKFREIDISFVSFFVKECTFDVYKLSERVKDLRFLANTTGTPRVNPANMEGAIPDDSIVTILVTSASL